MNIKLILRFIFITILSFTYRMMFKTRDFNYRKPWTIQQDDNMPNIRFGLCCINNYLRDKDIFCSRTTIRKNFNIDKAKMLATKNLDDVMNILKWNNEFGIHHYRLSSDMFPHINDKETASYSIDCFKTKLEEIGKYARYSDQRITMHPGQYNQIGAKSKSVFDATVDDLTHHAKILDYMGMDNNSILCIHGGGVYNDKENTIRRWIEQFSELPKNVKNRIAIENCELNYNIEDCLYISQECRIPVIFDVHHFNCYNKKYGLDLRASDYIPYIIDSWEERRMVAHISDQKENSRLGAHHDFVKSIPKYLMEIPDEYGVGVDIEIEAKAKEEAIFMLYRKYKDELGKLIDYRVPKSMVDKYFLLIN